MIDITGSRKRATFCIGYVILFLALASWGEVTKRNYAVIGLRNAEGISEGEADIIADRLRIELFNTGIVNMMERDQMQSILGEQGFQQSGACTDEACMVEMGQLLGVEKLVSGSIGKLGSMFLLNFRTIDVQTAKIVKVVSMDITGGIEDVVKHLPNIAKQLVGEKAGEKVKETKKEEPKPKVKKEEPEPQVEVPEKVPEETVVKDESTDRNSNRGGVAIRLNMYPTRPHIYGKSTVEFDRYKLYSEIYDDAEYNPTLSPHIKAIIKAGRFVTVNVGGGITFGKCTFTRDYYNSQTMEYEDQELIFRYFLPSLMTGVNGVFRIFPIKFNVGFILDFNWSIMNYKFTRNEENSILLPIIDRNTDFTFKITPGALAGVEFLLGTPHVGISIDAVLRPFNAEYDYNNSSESDKIELGSFGFGIGFHFYR